VAYPSFSFFAFSLLLENGGVSGGSGEDLLSKHPYIW